MPDIFVYFVCLAAGWALAAALSNLTKAFKKTAVDTFHLISKDILIIVVKDMARRRSRGSAGMHVMQNLLLFTLGMVFIGLAAGEFFGSRAALSLQEVFQAKFSRMCIVLFFGFYMFSYRISIVRFLKISSETIFKGESSSTVVQTALVVMLGLVLISALQPSLFEKISTFKAGEIEAEFKTDTSEVRPNVALISVRRSVAFNVWRNFELVDNFPNNAWRQLSFKLSNEDGGRIEFAQSVIHRQFAGLFDLGSCFQAQNLIDLLKDDVYFRQFVQDYIELVRSTTVLHYEVGSQLDVLTKSKLRNLYLQSLNIQRKLFFRLVESAASPDCLNDYRLFQEDSDAFKSAFRSQTIASLWEPYTISAISDFVGFVYGDKDKAEFLDSFITSDVGKRKLCSSACTSFIPIGLSSFYWYVVRAKIDSEDGWSAQDQIESVSAMLDWADRYIDADDGELSDSLRKKGRVVTPAEINELKQHYRRIKLQDLSLALEIFYKKALAGDKLTSLQKGYWKKWLQETTSIISAVENIGSATGMGEGS